MDKRNLFKGFATGTLAFITAGSGGRSVFAAKSDWRDEILALHTGYEIHNDMDVSYPRGSENGENRYVKVSTISIYFGETRKWMLLHRYTEWDHYYPYGKNRIVNEHREGDETGFDTLEEAFKYAKELKTKYYS